MQPAVQGLSIRLLFLPLALVAAFLLLSTRVEAEEPLVTTAYVVTSGDTLWEIAGTITEPGASVQAVIAEVRAINGLESTTLRPGQKLLLPTT